MSPENTAFDRELSLAELLPTKEAERLATSLGMLLDSPVAVLDLRGAVMAGAHGLAPDVGRVALILELEPVGYLLAPQASPGRLRMPRRSPRPSTRSTRIISPTWTGMPSVSARPRV